MSEKKLRAILVDDEAPARSRLARMLTQAHAATIEVVGEAANGLRALEEIDRLSPDVVFLDIEMPELDGLAVASCLRVKGPLVVFVTAYDDRAVKAFEVNAIDYLVKPVSDARLEAAVKRIAKLHRDHLPQELPKMLASLPSDRKPRRLAARNGSKIVVVSPEKLSAIVAKDHYAALLHDGRELLSDDGLEQWSSRLDAEKFIRIHRSAIVNLDYLKELQREGDRKYLAVLSDAQGTKLPVSREKLDELKVILGIDSRE